MPKSIQKFKLEKEIDKVVKAVDVDDAREAAISLVKQSRTNDRKKATIINDLKNTRTKEKIMMTMYNMVLSGEGMGSTTSKWSKERRQRNEEIAKFKKSLLEYFEI